MSRFIMKKKFTFGHPKLIRLLQKTCIKPLESYGLLLRSLHVLFGALKLVTIHLHYIDLQSWNIFLKSFVCALQKTVTHIWDGMRVSQ